MTLSSLHKIVSLIALLVDLVDRLVRWLYEWSDDD